MQEWEPILNRCADLCAKLNRGAIEQAEKCKRDTGSYPECIFADKIYITAKNRHYCMRHGIRIRGKRLGRPSQNPDLTSAQERQLRADQGRRNEVEGVFGCPVSTA